MGERIYKERAARNLSQSDLAEALEVSRQSASKWETDTSVPDLDKLVKMCELFEVSMDRLARGSEPEPPEGAPPAVVVRQGNGPLPVRIIVGLLLLSFGFLAVLLMLVNSWALLAAVPFLVCGTICLACKKNPVLICAWALWGLVLAVQWLYTRTSFGIIFNWGYYNRMWTRKLQIRWAEMAVLVILLGVTYHLARKWSSKR